MDDDLFQPITKPAGQPRDIWKDFCETKRFEGDSLDEKRGISKAVSLDKSEEPVQNLDQEQSEDDYQEGARVDTQQTEEVSFDVDEEGFLIDKHGNLL